MGKIEIAIHSEGEIMQSGLNMDNATSTEIAKVIAMLGVIKHDLVENYRKTLYIEQKR